jgi:sugar/nucleoside kinase (ribokinase family)
VRGDLLVLGPPCLDLSFHGLDELPAPGEEVFARSVYLGPGGAAISAIAAARLGVPVTLIWPVGTDPPGPRCDETAVSTVISLGGDRAIVSHAPEGRFAEIRSSAPEAFTDADAAIAGVEVSEELLRTGQKRTKLYAVLDDRTSRVQRLDDLSRLCGAHALLLNLDEARRITGVDDPAEAAPRLLEAARVDFVIITLGPEGALAQTAGRGPARARTPPVEAVDTTGAGDVFVSAYVWAELGGLELEERLGLACVAAALSVTCAGGATGAPALSEVARVARARGLALPGS